jgi:hypothetical protein
MNIENSPNSSSLNNNYTNNVNNSISINTSSTSALPLNGITAFELTVSVAFPTSLILTPLSLRKYQLLFRFYFYLMFTVINFLI